MAHSHIIDDISLEWFSKTLKLHSMQGSHEFTTIDMGGKYKRTSQNFAIVPGNKMPAKGQFIVEFSFCFATSG